jgi:hypothetical protein
VSTADRPALVRVVVDFSQGAFRANQVEALDPQPFDGGAKVSLRAPGARGAALASTGNGLTARVVPGHNQIQIAISAARRRFKYLAYRVRLGHQLVIDLYKSSPPSRAATIRRGARGCLTLERSRVSSSSVSASGREQGIFEDQFQVLLRGPRGGVAARRHVTAVNGAWSAHLSYRTSRREAATLEAVAFSAKDGALSCLVQVRVTLRAGPGFYAVDAAATPKRVYRTHADVNGDGRPDLVTLRKGSFTTPGRLSVALAGGRRLSVKIPTDAVYLPSLLAVGNVDGRRGAELFVDTIHVTTAESVGIFTLWAGKLKLAGTLSAFGEDSGSRFGISCTRRGARHLVIQHDFEQDVAAAGHPWTRRDTTYTWSAGALMLLKHGRAHRIHGTPPSALAGVQCGRVLGT